MDFAAIDGYQIEFSIFDANHVGPPGLVAYLPRHLVAVHLDSTH